MSTRFSGLKRFLRVPREPPTLPAENIDDVDRFRPHKGYRGYMAATRWAAVCVTAVSVAFPGIVVLIVPGGGSLHLLFFLGGFVALLFGIPLHVAAAIRWGTTWYALGRRSIRTRTGLWTITEATVTYDNVQNVKLKQGPVQRMFGISSLEIETAGGSSKPKPTTSNPGLKVLLAVFQVGLMFLPGGAAAAGGGFGNFGGNSGPGRSPGTMEGLGDARAVRETILRRVRRSRGAGLGDDRADAGPTHRITPKQVAEMRRIRDALSGV